MRLSVSTMASLICFVLEYVLRLAFSKISPFNCLNRVCSKASVLSNSTVYLFGKRMFDCSHIHQQYHIFL